MNEILQKRIEEAAKKTACPQCVFNDGGTCNNDDDCKLLDDFVGLMTFALQNQWISVEEALPEEKFNDGYEFVFVKIHLYDDTFYYDTDYIRKGKWELHKHQKITHWMPIPSLEGGEK